MSIPFPVATPDQTQSPSAAPQVRLRGLTRLYEEAGISHTILDHVDLDLAAGEFTVLLGKSGSGKSTLLNLIGGLDRPTSGDVWVGGTQVTALNEYALTLFRREQIGYVFQFFNLIPTLTVSENVMLPYELRGRERRAGLQKTLELLARVGLADRAGAYPDRLSGGEQQRVALARALVHSPALILADEPTGNLDEDTGETVLKLLLELTLEAGKTLIMATHNPDIVAYADAVFHIHEGKLIRDPLAHPINDPVRS